METLTTDVLVVGGGPAGLTAAALLAREGVPSLTVTKYSATADSPRAHITNQRAVEVLRDLGVEERVMRRALPQHLMGKQVFATAFAGREICRMMTWGTGDDRCGDYRAASPCEMCNAPQHVLEPILLDAARGFGADIRFDHEVVAVKQTREQVVARVRKRPNGEELEVCARYAIGCDGARSIVAEQGNFVLEGESGPMHAITVWIEADLTRYTKHRSGALFFVCAPGNEDVFSIWTCVEPWTEWSTILARHGGRPTDDLSEESVLRRVRRAVGDPTVEIKIKKISEWRANHVVAAAYRDRRLFLAGDAAHRHPPANGLGSNTSMQDTYNLAWKLALVTSGRARDSLLDSYSAERQPVGRQVVDRANQSVSEMLPFISALGFSPTQSEAEGQGLIEHMFGPAGETKRQVLLECLDLMNGQFNAHGVELNQRYESTAVVDDGTPFPAWQRDPVLYYQATSHPGAHLPHAWLQQDDRELSTLDVCAYNRFTLITGIDGERWREAAVEVTRRTGVAVHPVRIGLGQTYNDVLGAWTRTREMGDQGCLLVRPDRFVAWRSAGTCSDPAGTLHAVVRRILGH